MLINKPEPKSDSDELQADKWHTMSIQQLNLERDKVVKKLSMLHNLIGTTPSVMGLYRALEHAQTVLDGLITDRLTK